MSNYHELIDDPKLELHFIHFLGFRHMHRYTQHYLDPTSKYEPEIQGAYYESMRDGALEDLKNALRKEAGIRPTAAKLKEMLEIATQKLVERYGMETIVQKTREFLWEIEDRGPDELPLSHHYLPKPEFSVCPNCKRVRILLGAEDLPLEVFKTFHALSADMGTAWLCIKCKRITNE